MKLLLTFLALSFALSLTSMDQVSAQTTGTLTFSVTTTEPAGAYTGANVIALWITDTNNVFIKTRIRYAATRIQYLTRWISHSSYNVVDATTGPTRLTHGTLSFTWNGTDVSGNTVSDKPYRVWIQMSDANLPGAYTYYTFTKDTTTQNLTPADTMNFTSVSLSWNPVIGIDEDPAQQIHFMCTPNPVSDLGLITYFLPGLSDVTITLHDLSGRTIKVILDENQAAGPRKVLFGTDGIPAGACFLRINTGQASVSKKIVIR